MPRWVRAAGGAVLNALIAHGRAVALCAVPSSWEDEKRAALSPSEQALFRQLDDITLNGVPR
jgi:hypothetical protein